MISRGIDAEVRVRQITDDRVEVQVGDRTYVIAGSCPHRKGRMAYGYVNTRTTRVTCPLHHSTFELASGQMVSGPSERPLPVCQSAPGREIGRAAPSGRDGEES